MIPDRIERVLDLAHPPAKVWAAITTAEGLGTWFGKQASIDLRPGGAGRLTWPDNSIELRVERVDEPRVFAFTWPVDGRPGDQRRTYVEFTLEPAGDGTRLTVVETGFAQFADDTAYRGNSDGWGRELAELVEYLDAA
ncbi:SRPBCC domain-containing protein [Kribbella sp. CA-253562]|uniref:SRPBCC domain-containing protein n=1 Tax=Kribbella sp. CA-253562 TaxID=3239942 RepID=UPI003D91EC6F